LNLNLLNVVSYEVIYAILLIGLAIESELTIYSLLTLQVATQPLLTAAPTNYPIVQAAYDALRNSQSR